MVCNKKIKPVFIKRKWNHVVFSRAIILSFHPVVAIEMEAFGSPSTKVVNFTYLLCDQSRLYFSQNKCLFMLLGQFELGYIARLSGGTFKSHVKRSNTELLRVPTITILPTRAGTFHSFNCFSQVIYMPTTSLIGCPIHLALSHF